MRVEWEKRVCGENSGAERGNQVTSLDLDYFGCGLTGPKEDCAVGTGHAVAINQSYL
jgi:hypothetical protein